MKCVCKKTHTSGKNLYIIDQNYSYHVYNTKRVQVVYDNWIEVPANYRVYNIPHQLGNQLKRKYHDHNIRNQRSSSS